MKNVIDKKQMHDSVIMGKENASKEWIVSYWGFWRVLMSILYLVWYQPEVAGVTFSDSDSAPVLKFWNPRPDPGPAILQIWESDTCSDSGCSHQSNLNLSMFLLKKLPNRLLLLPKLKKVTPIPGPVFPKFLTPVPDPGPKEKRRIRPESTPVIRIRSHLWYQHMIIAAGLTLVAKSCTLRGAFWLPGLADYPLRSGCAKNTLWVVAPCSMNMSQQYFGEINWGFSFSMQFYEALQLLKPKF